MAKYAILDDENDFPLLISNETPPNRDPGVDYWVKVESNESRLCEIYGFDANEIAAGWYLDDFTDPNIIFKAWDIPKNIQLQLKIGIRNKWLSNDG